MQTIGVNIVPGNFPQFIRYSQNDIGREFKINVVDFDIPSGATVECVATKPSGLGFTVSGTVTDNTVSFITTAIMTDEWGKFPAELRISSGGEVLGTANFMFIGERNPHPEGTTDGQQGTIIPELTLLVNEIRESNARVAEMTASAHTSDVPTAEYDADTNNIEFGIPSIPEEEFLKAFVTDSASGSIASITDGGDDLPVKSLNVNIVPKQSGSGDPSPSNVRPISGWDAVGIQQRGKNVLNLPNTSRTSGNFQFTIAEQLISMQGVPTSTVTVQVRLSLPKGGTWVLSTRENLPSRTRVYCERINKSTNAIDYPTLLLGTAGTTSAVVNCDVYTYTSLIFEITTSYDGVAYSSNFQLERGTTATSYEPYQGTSYPIPLPSTVYGGELDVVSGEGKAWTRIDLGALVWQRANTNIFYTDLPTNAKAKPTPNTQTLNGRCEILKLATFNETYANRTNNTIATTESGARFWAVTTLVDSVEDFKALVNGKYITYELATPTDFQTTPTEIITLLGNNNIYSSCGDVEVEYRADTKLYIDKLLGNTRTLSMAMAPETTEETTEEEPAEEEQR